MASAALLLRGLQKYNSIRSARIAKWNVHKKNTLDLDKNSKTLDERLTALEQRKESIAEVYGRVGASGSDILNINVGGEMVKAKRETLTQYPGAGILALFSGRWDQKIPKDVTGNLFVDTNPESFKSIITSLTDYKMSPNKDFLDTPIKNTKLQPTTSSLIDAFGLIYDSSAEFDSTIVRSKQNLRALLQQTDNAKRSFSELEVIYRTSRDGFHVPNMSAPDGAENIIVVKLKDGCTFAGLKLHSSSDSFGIDVKSFNFRKRDWHRDSNLDPTIEFPSEGVFVKEGLLGKTVHPYVLLGRDRRWVEDIEIIHVKPGDATMESSSNLEESIAEEMQAFEDAQESLREQEEALEKERSLVEALLDDSPIVYLEIGSTIRAVHESTIAQYPESVLYQQVCAALPCKWTKENVMTWLKGLKCMSSVELGRFSNVTGEQLLSLSRTKIQELGVDRPELVEYLWVEIGKVCDVGSSSNPIFLEYDANCMTTILDCLSAKALSSKLDYVPAPDPPSIEESECARFKDIVEYSFPGDSAKDFLGREG